MPDNMQPIIDKLITALDEDYVIRLTRDLVRIPSVYRPEEPGGNETQAAQCVADELRQLGLEVHVEEAAPGRPNVVADWVGSGPGPCLMFEGHTDVVTEGDHATWTYPPFAAHMVDGRIFGRGAADMKSGVAAAIAAVKAIQDSGVDLPGRIRLGIVADEEDMMQGIKHFIRTGWAKDVDGAIICEPEENEVCLTQKGAMRVRVTFTGKMAHGAMPKTGINPVPWAAAFVQGVGNLEERLIQEVGSHHFLGEPSVTPTVFQAPSRGPAQLNVVASEAKVLLDIRTIPGVEHEHIREELEGVLERVRAEDPRCRAELEVYEERPWTETAPDDPIVRACEAACRLGAGREPKYGGVPGATDGTFLHHWAHIPIVTMGPGDRYIPHHSNEWVDSRDIIEAAKIYIAAAALFLTGKA